MNSDKIATKYAKKMFASTWMLGNTKYINSQVVIEDLEKTIKEMYEKFDIMNNTVPFTEKDFNVEDNIDRPLKKGAYLSHPRLYYVIMIPRVNSFIVKFGNILGILKNKYINEVRPKHMEQLPFDDSWNKTEKFKILLAKLLYEYWKSKFKNSHK